MAPVLARLPALAGRGIERVELTTTWIKPRRHFNASYRVFTNEREAEPIRVSAFLVSSARATRVLQKQGPHVCSQHGDRSACRRCQSDFVEPGVLIQLFPRDYRLPTLSRCLDRARLKRSLASNLAPDCIQVVAYRPGMRCQIRYATAGGRTYFGKVSVEKRGRGYAFATHREVARAVVEAGVGFRVPELIGYVPDLALTLISAASGDSLYDSYDSPGDPTPLIEDAARVLAELHRLELSTERTYTVNDELSLLEAWVSLVSGLVPELSDGLLQALQALSRTKPNPVPASAILHRDFYDKQVLFSSDRPVLLDLDTTCAGDPELDVSNFVAHFSLRALQRRQMDRFEPMTKTFLRAYPRALRPDRLRWYRIATLLRLACNYALRPRWRHVASPLVAEAAALTGGGDV